MLEIKKVFRKYGKKEDSFLALKNINLSFEAGSTNAIVGKSGSGKSTLLHIITGLDHPSEGSVTFDDKNIYKQLDTDKWRGENIGIIFQQFFLQPANSVLDNVALPLKIRGVSRKKREARALEALKSVGILEKAKSKANDLSGGQKQRVAIARAIIDKPSILIADEPTGNLDSESGEAIIKLLFELNKTQNATLIIVTHDHDIAKKCGRIIELKDGLVERDRKN